MTLIKNFVIFLQIIFSVQSFATTKADVEVEAQKYEPNWESIDSRPLPSWYDESKIGIFVHWGLYSVPSFSSEWFWWRWKGAPEKMYIEFMANNFKPGFTYADFANQFTAEFYDPDKWAEIFKASGAKYVVLTSKHHEGFTLWPSKYSWNWNSVDIGSNRDLMGDLATAVRKAGLRFGAYHSWFEWFNPLFLADKDAGWKTQHFVKTKSRPELEELINKYKPDVIWSDGDEGSPDTYWNSTDFLAWLYNESPVKDTVVVNDRWGDDMHCKHGGYYTCYDRYNPGVLQKHKWENAMTYDRYSWGYRRNAELSDFLTTDELITELAKTISCGGNMLINIGPTHDGRIVPIFEERLRELGYWLSTNGEAIYGTKPWTHQNDTITQDIWYTSKDKVVYTIALDWPQSNELMLGSIQYKTVHSIALLGVKSDLAFKESGAGTLVTFPYISPDSGLKWAFVLKITTN